MAQAAQQGDPRATQQLLEAVTPRIGRVIRVVLGADHPDRDDAEQLALIAFTQALVGFRGECEPTHYASRIAVRTALHARQRSRKQQARFDDLAELDEPGTPSAHEDALAERRKRHVRELLQVIPTEQAEGRTHPSTRCGAGCGWPRKRCVARSRPTHCSARSFR